MLKFMFNEVSLDEKRATLVQGLETLAKMAINKKVTDNSLAIKFSVVEEDYSKLNALVKEGILNYSKEQANLPEAIDVFTKAGLTRAMGNENFEWNFFSIQTQVLGALLANTEVTKAMDFVNMMSVSLGDSMTFQMGSKALYDVEDMAYGNTVTRARKHFMQPITIVPSPKSVAVQFDFIQMITSDYDFGAEMAKVVLSVRSKQYQDAVDLIFTSTPLVGTPFFNATFNKANYTDMADKLVAVNNAGVRAYATRRAFADASEVVTTGFTTLDEINKKTYIADLFGVPSQIIDQSVDTSTASFANRVPNDKILLLSDIGDKPIKIVGEDYMDVQLVDGKNVKNKTYQYIYSYGIGLATPNAYGIIGV